MKKFYYIWAVLFSFGAPAFALSSDILPESMTNIMKDGVIYQGGLLRAVISLFIVIGLVYLTAWAYKKLNSINEKTITAGDKKLDINKFKVISTQALGSNKNLHVVEINGKYLVIGSTPNNITLIKEFEKTPEALKETGSQHVKNAARQEVQPKSQDAQMQDILDKYRTP